MANDNYIGIAMGMDVTDLKAGLSEANKQIQLANSEFKASASSMDDWTKSTEGLSAKVKQLDTVLTAQRSKLSGLQAEYDKVAKSQGENSEQARKLKVQINNQQSIVNKTEKEYNNYKETLEGVKAGSIDLEKTSLKMGKAVEQAGDNAEDASGKMDGLKGVAGGVMGAIAGLGAVVAGAVTGFLSLAESTRETRTMLGQLETAFTTAGLSAEDATSTYEKLYGVLGDEGQATEASLHIANMAQSQEDLAKWTDIATGVYATFGASLPIENLAEASAEVSKTGILTGGLTDALNWAGVSEEEFQKKLDACNNEQERQALITETLTAKYSEASNKYKEVNNDLIEAQEATARYSNAMAELGAIAEPIMTTLKLVAVELLESIKPFVSLIGEGLTGAFNGSAEGASLLAEGIGGILNILVERVSEVLPTVLDIILQLLPQVVQTLLNALPTVLETVITLFKEVLNTLSSMLPTLIPIIIDAVLMIVETLLDNLDQLIDAGIKLIMALADGLINALPKLIDKIPVIISKLLTAISNNLPKLVEAGVQLIIKLAGGLIKAIPHIIKAIPQIISSLINGFKDYYSNMGDVGLNLLKGIWDGIKNGASWLKNKITGFAGDVAGWFKKTFKIQSPSQLMADEVGLFIGEGIGEGVIKSIPHVKKDLGEFSNFVTNNLGNIKSGLAVDGLGNTYTGRGIAGGTVVNAGMTVNYNGSLSRKELYKIENDNKKSILKYLKAEGGLA